MGQQRDSGQQPRHEAAIAPSDADGWRFTQSAFDRARQSRDESLFALANGSLGVRGGGEDGQSDTQACYLAAVCERHPIAFHERLPGFAHHTDTRVPVADGTTIMVTLGELAANGSQCVLVAFERSLDLRRGVLHRHAMLRLPDGSSVRIDSERVVAIDSDVMAIRLLATSVDYSGPITLTSILRAGRATAGQGDDPRIGVAGGGSLVSRAGPVDAEHASLIQHTRHSNIALASVQVHRLDGALEWIDADAADAQVSQRFDAVLAPGGSVAIEKFVAYASAFKDGEDVATLHGRAGSIARIAARDGYDALAEARAAQLDNFWKDVDLGIDDNNGTVAALRFNLFHVQQSASRTAEHGTAAKGLTGEGYEGHCFWDTEVFVLPVMVFTAPAVARSMLGWRHRTLDAARANARGMNHAVGALYPWRTIKGAECSAHYPSGSAAYHINADIAFAIGLYLDATNDVAFLLAEGAEMLFETARIWPQVGHFDPLRGGAFGIYCVTGPDEYSALVDNNFYTNRMAQRHLLRAVAVWVRLSATHPAELQALADRMSLDAGEIDLWQRAAEAMQLGVDAELDIYAQDDGFLHKLRWDRPAESSRKALLLEQHPLTLYRHQVCKQADVVMALAIAGDGLDAAIKRRSFDYYEPITTHDSTLSAAIHGIVASELGRTAQALEFFDAALHVDLDDLHGNTAHGVHMAAMAGSWLGIVWGFAGVRVVAGGLQLSPTLPPAWRGYRFSLHWQGRRLSVQVDHESTTYKIDSGEPLAIQHRGTAVDVGIEPMPIPHVLPAAQQTPDGDLFPRKCRALIFDLDGVLTDTAHVHYQAWKRLADSIGVPFDETINRRLKGVDRMASLEIILERADRVFDDAQKQAFAAAKNDDYVAAIKGFGPGDLLRGVRELLAAARAAGLRIALASASRNAGTLVERLGIASAFDAVVDAGTIAHAKPAPDIFLAAARALGVEPSACIGIEDAAAGVAAIKAAGMTAIGIGDAVELAQADTVIDSIAALHLEDVVVLPVSPAVRPSPGGTALRKTPPRDTAPKTRSADGRAPSQRR